LISLMTDRRARGDDPIPDGTDPRGWWADAMDGQQIGSRLWLLERARNLPEVLRLAEDYIKEALQWLVDDGVAGSITASCSATRGCNNTLDMLISICRPKDGDLQFKWRYAWDLRELRQC
jgi:phage gp46-like protein